MITDYHVKYYAYELTRQCAADGVDRLSQSLFDATVDLNPHQINAALFALNNPLNNHCINIIKIVNSRNLAFFDEEVNKLDHWADDLKFGLEQSIKEIDQQIKEVRRNAKIAPTLAEKLAFQKQQQELERTRNKQRKELFDRQDEIDERREALIGQLESKLNQHIEVEDLFIIHWSL